MDTNTNTQTKALTTTDPGTPATPVTPTTKKRLRAQGKASLADRLRDWSELLAAVADHGTDLGGLEAQRTALQALLDQGRTLSAQQNALTASSQVTTKQLQGVLRDGKKVASRLRSGVKAQFGFSDEKLVQFGSKPLRRHPRAKTPASQTPTPGQ